MNEFYVVQCKYGGRFVIERHLHGNSCCDFHIPFSFPQREDLHTSTPHGMINGVADYPEHFVVFDGILLMINHQFCLS